MAEGRTMATSHMSEVIQHLRRIVLLREVSGLTDGQLLGCFIEQRDDAAFAALVKRHGPMVWGVCRRLLNPHDAEDAFQATFLVLVRKAASIVPRDRMANWLYGVAHQTALQASRTAARRRARLKQVATIPEPAVVEPDLWSDLQPLLDQELSRLPLAYREVIVLCDLEGKTRKETARQLGIPEGTVGSRLARARTMLARRLARHGLPVSEAALAAVLAENVASAGVPSSVVSATIKAVTLVTAGQAAAAGAISVKVATLTEGVLRAMLLTKLKITAAVVLIAVCFSGGAGLIYQTQAAQDATGQEQQARTLQRAEEPARQRDDQKLQLQRRIGELESQIQNLTNELKSLQSKLKGSPAPTPAKTEVKVFAVHHGSAEEVAQVLWELYRSKGRSELRIAKTNNAIIVVGSPDDLRVVETIVTQLEKLPQKKGS
jgi:RNA polymerase sigma factor (sigma-70 family)